MGDNGGFYITFDEGSLEVKLPTTWTDEKNRCGKGQRREEQKKEDQKREKPEDRRRRCVKR